MATTNEIVKAELPNGAYIHIETTLLDGEEDVAFTLPTFKEVTEVIEGIAESVVTSLEKVKPQKASVEFGLEVALESGKLSAREGLRHGQSQNHTGVGKTRMKVSEMRLNHLF